MNIAIDRCDQTKRKQSINENMRIISESNLAADTLIVPISTNQTNTPSGSASSTSSFSPNSDPGMPSNTTFHAP